MNRHPTRDDVLIALSTVQEGDTDIVSANRISGITIKEGSVGFILETDPTHAADLQAKCERALRAFPGINKVTIVTTSHSDTPTENRPLSTATAGARSGGVNAEREGAEPPVHAARGPQRLPIPGVKRIIAIASGKGGVGKSSVTVLLAHALTSLGQRVAICDADIYGPSIPRMMGLALDQPKIQEGKMLPPFAHNIAINSMALITGDSAAILRGPMISKSLQQLLRSTDWPNIDTLLVDLPPGTGDVQLSLVQNIPIDGVILVTTPQEIAVMDARKAASMFNKTNIPILGIIENMTHFTDPTGKKHPLFGKGGGSRLAKEFDLKLLAQLPLDPALGTTLDNGQAPTGETLEAITQVAKTLAMRSEP